MDWTTPAFWIALLEIMEACGFTVTRNPSEMAKLLKALL